MATRRTFRALAMGSLLLALLIPPLPCPGAQVLTVRIGGNGSAIPALKLLAKAYQQEHPGVTVTLVPNLGSSGGIAALKEGALDLAVSARPLRPDEQGPGVRSMPYASTPLLFAVHRGVPKTDVTPSELARIFSQKTVRWSDGSRIRMVLRPEKDADTTLVQKISPEVARALQQALAKPGMTVAVNDQEALDAIARLPGAIGSTSLTELQTQRRPVQPLSFQGVKPTLQNLASGSYPLVKRYYLVTGEHPSEEARHFASFLRSPKGRELLTSCGNLPAADQER